MKLFVEYGVTENCNNLYSFGELCVKCGDCGRKFTNDGILIKEGETKEEVEEQIKRLVEILLEDD